MAEHKKQHFVPRSYLKAWCDPNTPAGQAPYVWRFDKDGSNASRKAPDNLFHETDLYTINLPGGGRNLVIEHGLSGLESEFVGIREKLSKQEPLTPDEHAGRAPPTVCLHGRRTCANSRQARPLGRAVEPRAREHGPDAGVGAHGDIRAEGCRWQDGAG